MAKKNSQFFSVILFIVLLVTVACTLPFSKSLNQAKPGNNTLQADDLKSLIQPEDKPSRSSPSLDDLKRLPATSEVVSPENAHRVQQLAYYGKGNFNFLTLSPQGDQFAVVWGNGISMYSSSKFKETHYIDTDSFIYRASYSPDGRILAFGEGETIRLWDTKSNKQTLELNWDDHLVTSLAFSPDGANLTVGCGEGYISLWNVHTGELIQTLRGHSNRLANTYISDLSYSMDGDRLASAGGEYGDIFIWDVQTGEKIQEFEGHQWGTYAITFFRDNVFLASGGGDKFVRIWEIQHGNQVAILEGHEQYVFGLAYSPDDEVLASCADDNTIIIWDYIMDTPRKVIKTGHGWKSPCSLAFTKDGNKLISGGSDNTIRLWDVQTGEKLQILGEDEHGIYNLAFSPDGRQLAMGGDDDKIIIWDTQSGKGFRVLQGQGKKQVNSLVYSPDGSMLASCSGMFIQLWDPKTGTQIKAIDTDTPWLANLSFSPDGKILASDNASGDGTILLWDVQTGELRQVLEGHKRSETMGLAYSPDGNLLASNGKDNIRLWDAHTGQFLQYFEENDHSYGGPIAFSPDGRILAAGRDETFLLLDIQTGEKLQESRGRVIAFAFSPDGLILASCNPYGSIMLWNTQTGELLNKFEKNNLKEVNSLAFSPDGRILASIDLDNTLRFWGIP